jgi:hypothetical protein
MSAKKPYLTKSRFLAGLQCHRRLWLQVHGPREDIEETPIQRSGRLVGELARKRFPGGVLVDQAPWEHVEATERTAHLMGDSSVPAIFEAAFQRDGLRIRVDVLERQPRGRWGLIEVKSASAVKDYYIEDVAFQTFVLESAGIRLSGIEVMHLNKFYRRAERGLNLGHLFKRSDLKAEVRERLASLPGDVIQFLSVLRRTKEPPIEPWSHCSFPVSCEWFDRCSANKASDWILNLPNLSSKKADALRSEGIDRIRDIPAEFPLTPLQLTVRKVQRSGRAYVSPDLTQAIAKLGPPTAYLDFETFGPAVPPFAGLKPYEAIPFQWSLHRISKKGNLQHAEFLAEQGADPRREFLTSLLDVLSDGREPIAVYSSYELQILRGLARVFPQDALRIKSVIERLVDLLPIVRSGIYLRKFGGSFSIKSVAPALTRADYAGLNIADGGNASASFELINTGGLSEEEVNQIRADLLAYCHQDTLALVHVHRRMMDLAAQTRIQN